MSHSRLAIREWPRRGERRGTVKDERHVSTRRAGATGASAWGARTARPSARERPCWRARLCVSAGQLALARGSDEIRAAEIRSDSCRALLPGDIFSSREGAREHSKDVLDVLHHLVYSIPILGGCAARGCRRGQTRRIPPWTPRSSSIPSPSSPPPQLSRRCFPVASARTPRRPSAH